MRQAARAMDEVDESGTLRAQRAAIHRVIRIALNMKNARLGIFCAIAEAVHEHATGDGTVRTGVARLGGARELEFAHFGERCSGGEPEQHQARTGQRGACYFKEFAPRHISHGNPLACLQTRRSLYPCWKGLQGSDALSRGTHASLFFCYAWRYRAMQRKPARRPASRGLGFASLWLGGREVMQRPAKPSTPVRFRP